ncbi:sialic acid-binding Ig-like lectin 14 [Cyprinodon tularosa]|uniref:sialic acid-binding Ig-like lectin 14 n=1 Tax=Cyprinodon tularosa TaxID=77115 RepID=UPI0018E1F1A1|nr:sialic acid-binding Ig-like lectin 14 [Cyprinodon tularosa]
MCVPFSSDAPKDTSASISPSGLVSAGSWVELSCSSRAKPPASFNWFRNSKHGAINVSVGQVYSFNVTEGEEYYCEATNDLGNQRSAVILLNTEAKSYLFLVTVVVGVFLFVCLVLSVWFLTTKCPTPDQTQSQIYQVVSDQIEANETEEELHYEDIAVLQRRPEASSVSVQDDGQQETEYAQVKVSTDHPEDLYAQVKKQ